MALAGVMNNIKKRAEHIVPLGGQYRSFGETLRRPAKGFEEKEILALVEHFIRKEDKKQ